MLLILRYQAIVDKSLKHIMIQKNNALRRRLKLLTKKYLIIVAWSKRLTAIQKLKLLKTRYLVLLH